MREPARNRERLQHMLEAIANIHQFTDNVSREDLFSDKMRYFAVVKNVEIIGEAAYMLTKEFRTEHTELPWNAIIGMRHVIVHDYINIHERLLWDTIQHDIDPLRVQILKYLEQMQ